jgi:hypothetical protein
LSLVSNAFIADNFSIKSKATHNHIRQSDNWWRALGFDISGRERLESLVDYLSEDVSSTKGNKDSTNI